MFKLMKLRIKKLFTRKASKTLKTSVNKKQKAEHKGEVADIKKTMYATKQVKQNHKTIKQTDKINTIIK